MTPDQLRRIGEVLYGDRWQGPMTDALGLRDTSRIREMLSGKRIISAGIADDLRARLHARLAAVRALMSELDRKE